MSLQNKIPFIILFVLIFLSNYGLSGMPINSIERFGISDTGEFDKKHLPDVSFEINDSLLGVIVMSNLNESADEDKNTYYGFELFYPKDSSFKIVNVFGEYTGGASYNPFSQPFIVRNKKLLRGELYGEVFRADRITENHYLFYCDDYSRMGSSISVYDIFFEADSIRKVETDVHGNYMFDLITNKKEVLTSMPDNLTITERFTENELSQLRLDTTTLQVNDYYILSDGDPFLKTELIQPRFILYYKCSFGDQLEKILRIETGEDEEVETRDITLSMYGGDSDYYTLSSEFKNDSIFIQTLSNRETKMDGERLRGENIDSMVIRFHYDEQFDFIEIGRDSFHFETEDSLMQNEFKKIRTTYFSKPYLINGMNLNWVYRLMYSYDEYGNALYAKMFDAKLINADRKIVLVENEDILVHDPVDFINDREENFKDLNFDGYKDCLIRSETSSGSGGDFYDAFIFSPKNNTFNFSKELSGGNPEINDSLKTVTYFLKAGYYDNGTTIIHFGEKGKMLFTEKIRKELISDDPIKVKQTYKKFVNGKVVKSRSRIYSPGEGE